MATETHLTCEDSEGATRKDVEKNTVEEAAPLSIQTNQSAPPSDVLSQFVAQPASKLTRTASGRNAIHRTVFDIIFSPVERSSTTKSERRTREQSNYDTCDVLPAASATVAVGRVSCKTDCFDDQIETGAELAAAISPYP